MTRHRAEELIARAQYEAALRRRVVLEVAQGMRVSSHGAVQDWADLLEREVGGWGGDGEWVGDREHWSEPEPAHQQLVADALAAIRIAREGGLGSWAELIGALVRALGGDPSEALSAPCPDPSRWEGWLDGFLRRHPKLTAWVLKWR